MTHYKQKYTRTKIPRTLASRQSEADSDGIPNLHSVRLQLPIFSKPNSSVATEGWLTKSVSNPLENIRSTLVHFWEKLVPNIGIKIPVH